MGSIRKQTPTPPQSLPPVTEDTTAVKEAARLEAERLRSRRGFASTILTGPEGVTTPATVRRETLG